MIKVDKLSLARPRVWGNAIVNCVTALLLACFFSLQVSRALAEVSQSKIRLGVVVQLTGLAAVAGEEARQAIEMAADEYRSKGLRPIELFFEDSHYDPKKGIQAYQALRAIYGIQAVISGASHVSLAIQPMAARDGVPQMCMFCSSQKYSSANDLSVRISSPSDLEVRYLVNYFKRQGFNRLAVFSAQNDFGASFAAAFETQVRKELGPTALVSNESFMPDQVDFRSELLRIRSKNAQALFIIGAPEQYGLILRQAKSNDSKLKFFGMRAVEDSATLKVGGSSLEGLVYTFAFDIDSPNPEVRKFVVEFERRHRARPHTYAAEGYEAFRIMSAGLNKCGLDNKCLVEYFPSVQNYSSLFGNLSMDHMGDVTYPYFLKTIRDGKFVKFES